MVQMNQATPEVNPMFADPALGRILSLGINPDPKPPKIMIRVGDLTITVQPDGQVALFKEGGLFACECKGTIIEALPETAELQAALSQDNTRIGIYQDGKAFFTKRRKGKITALKITDYTSPYAAVAEIDDNSPELCRDYHTSDPSIDDDEYDDTPLPTRLPDDDD